MTHSQAIKMRNNLSRVERLKGFELNYCIEQNLEALESAIKPLAKQEKEFEEIIKMFNTERTTLAERLSMVDGEVKKKIENGSLHYDISDENMPEYEKELSKLKEKNKKQIKEYETKKAEFTKFLDEKESPFKPILVKHSCVPSDITTEQMKFIYPILK